MAIRIGREAKSLIKYAESLGFDASITRKNHLRFVAPGCRPVFAAGTPSDHRSIKNSQSELRQVAKRGGLV